MCMLRIAGQTAGPIGLKCFVDTHGWPKYLFFSTGNPGSFSKYYIKARVWVEHGKSKSQGLEIKSNQIIRALYFFLNLRSL